MVGCGQLGHEPVMPRYVYQYSVVSQLPKWLVKSLLHCCLGMRNPRWPRSQFVEMVGWTRCTGECGDVGKASLRNRGPRAFHAKMRTENLIFPSAKTFLDLRTETAQCPCHGLKAHQSGWATPRLQEPVHGQPIKCSCTSFISNSSAAGY